MEKVFSKCAESLENGRRLENLSWRLWNRETFCCDDEPTLPTIPIRKPMAKRQDSEYSCSDMPELSTSVESAPSDDELPKQRTDSVRSERPCLIRSDSSDRYRGKEKHMTQVNLAKIMEDIDRNKSSAEVWNRRPDCRIRKASSMPTERVPAAMTALSKSLDEGSESRNTHSVVRGFSPSRISSSYRSSTNISVAETPATTAPSSVMGAKKSSPYKSPVLQKKKPTFYLGASSSSSEGSHLEESFRSYKKPVKKTASFVDEVSTRTLYDDDLSSDDDDVSESAIEDDDMEWESSSESGHSSYNEGAMFQRVESRPDLLRSRRSLLSTMLHEPERAAELQAQASRSTTALRRMPSPHFDVPHIRYPSQEDCQIPGAQAIRVTTGGAHPPTLSPRTTRRNMLSSELTESLRKHLLWERKQKTPIPRRNTSIDVAGLGKYAEGGKGRTSKNNSWHDNKYEYNDFNATGW